jgi:hypothetical protein
MQQLQENHQIANKKFRDHQKRQQKDTPKALK